MKISEINFSEPKKLLIKSLANAFEAWLETNEHLICILSHVGFLTGGYVTKLQLIDATVAYQGEFDSSKLEDDAKMLIEHIFKEYVNRLNKKIVESDSQWRLGNLPKPSAS
jgi:hypothetical protein